MFKWFKFNNLLFVWLTLVFTSCEKDTTYSVPSDLQSYVDKFRVEAAKRNRTFDFSKTGLIIQFSKLKDGIAGLCHYEQPIRIEIDSVYWKQVGNTAGAEQMHEDVVFHELGHGFLNRDHDNSLLPNGDWKSMMCGGDKVNNRPWNINYRGMRRDYYLDELFNASAPAPAFSSPTLPVDTAGYVLQSSLNFDSESQSGWKIGDFSQYTSSIDNGKLKFVSKINSTYLVVAASTVDIQSDFSFELSIQIGDNVPSDFLTGILWGYLGQGVKSFDYFAADRQNHFFNGNTEWYSFNTELTSDKLSADGMNKLKIVKSGEIVYYFINDHYVYQDIMETTASGNRFGFMVAPYATIWIDDLKIATKGSSSAGVKRQNVQSGSNLKFDIIEQRRIPGNIGLF